MKNLSKVAEKYAEIRNNERLDFTELRQLLKQDGFSKYQINRIVGVVYQLQESKRVGYHKKIEVVYPFVFGIIMLSASLYFYELGDGLNLIENARGIGRKEYGYLIGTIILFAIGIFLLIHGYFEWGKYKRS